MENSPLAAFGIKRILLASAAGITAVIIFMLWWLFFISPAHPAGGLGWYLFAFATGLTMIVLPCTLPLAFVIVPLSMGKGLVKGVSIALSFGAGVALMLSIYGVLAALIGGAAIGQLGAPLEVVKNWVYFIAGIFALLFALGEIGLIKVRMPSYTGAAPAFIQKRGDYIKAFLLGVFLGNIGVGCPHPATPLLLIEIASSGDVTYGWSLFLTHAIGRVLPLILLSVLAILGVNGLNWLVAKKDKIERATGWAMVFVAGFILTLGLFSHAWWVSSGIHTAIEQVTQEHAFLGALNAKLETNVVHSHGTEELVGKTGLFGLPLNLGNWVLVALWIFPIWWWWRREKKRIDELPGDKQISEKDSAHTLWRYQERMFTVISILLAVVFIWALPQWFLATAHAPHSHGPGVAPHDHPAGTPANHEHAADMGAAEHTMMSGDMMSMSAHAGHAATYHEVAEVTEGLAVSMMVTPEKPKAGEEAVVTFFAHTRPDNTPYDNLAIEREKYMHVIGVRNDLGEFFHIHPEKVGPGLWGVVYTFKEPGNYKIYTDVADQSGMMYTFGQKQFSVASGEGAPLKISTPPIEYLQNVVVGGYQVAFEHDSPLVAGKTSELRFTVNDVYGKGVVLDNYLGVSMHLSGVGFDLSQYVHTHPADHVHEATPADESMPHSHSFNWHIGAAVAEAHEGEEGTGIMSEPVSFQVPFAKPGVYRLFAQFRPKGANLGPDEALVAPFFVNVEADAGQAVTKLPVIAPFHDEAAPMNPQSQKAALVFVSLILMSLLSLFVYKKLLVM